MARARKFAETRNAATSEVLIQHFCPAAENDSLSIGLRILTHQLQLKTGKESGGGFGGPFGYGVDFENDVFEMRYDREDYDCTCGATDTLHTEECQATMRVYNDARMKFLYPPMPDGEYEAEVERNMKRGMSRRMAAFHACAQPVDFSQLIKRGDEYDRVHPWPSCACPPPHGGEHDRLCRNSIAQRPNFTHKPSGLAVRWYKYIGRDMEMVHQGTEQTLGDLLSDCLRSIEGPSIEDAIHAYGSAEKEAAEQSRRVHEWMTSDDE